MGSCSSEPETRTHVLLHCQTPKLSRSKLIKNVYNLDQLYEIMTMTNPYHSL